MEQTLQVQTIQVVLEAPLLRAADRTAKRLKMNRSALFREAVRLYLRELDKRSREERDRQGYEHVSERVEDLAVWDRVAAWPEE